MGGELPVIPTVVTEPTVAEWNAFMTALATAGADATVSMVIQDASITPTVADFRVPAKWITVSPRFAVTPPVIDPPVVTPPPVVYEIMYVTSTTGLKVREQPTTSGKQIGTLAYRAQANVTGSTPADGFTWAQLQSGGYVAREYLSKVQPNP